MQDLDLTAVEAAARRLETAARSGVPCAPVRDLIGADVDAAYAVQRRVVAARVSAGAPVVGRKIGLTSEAVRRQLGVHEPDYGVLVGDMSYSDGDTVSMRWLLQPRVEAEVAFVLGGDLDGEPLDHEQVRRAVDYVTPALEICDSRIDGWDISLADTIADNASSGVFVLGSARRSLSELELPSLGMTMEIDGDVRSTGAGAACMGDPLNAVVWLARRVRELGVPLRAGEVVLSGALGPMQPIGAGSTVRAVIADLGTVGSRFTS